MRVFKRNTLVWYLLPCFCIYKNGFEIKFIRYHIYTGGCKYEDRLFEGFFIVRRNTYFNELAIGLNKWYWKVFSEPNNPPRWDK